jgi:DNA-binding CsgD family transcriptional regulator
LKPGLRASHTIPRICAVRFLTTFSFLRDRARMCGRLVLAKNTPETMNVLPQSLIPVDVVDVLESLRCGGFLLDIAGRVLSFNVLAFGCLGDGLILGGEHLNAIDRLADQRLQHLVGAALSAPGAHASKSIAVPRPDRLPLVIRTLRLQEHAAQPMASPSLLLLVLDPERWPEPSHEILSQAFGLTQAEADVAIGIVSGRPLSKIAADRGVKVGTVRAHSKTVFSKTHTCSQADLTRVLTRLAFLVAPTGREIAPVQHLDQASIPLAAGSRRRAGGTVEPNARGHANASSKIRPV